MEKEKENFLRNLRVLVECGNEALREVLGFELSKQNVTLEQFLSQYRHDIYHRFEAKPCCQCSSSRQSNVRKVFQKAQLDILLDRHQHLPGHNSQSMFLFCCSPVKSTVTLEDLDTTLIRSLLANFGSNYQNNSGIATYVENLIKIRNKYAHMSHLKISDGEFKVDKNDIINTIRQIISLCGCLPDSMDMHIADLYQKTLDSSLLMQYHAKLVEDLEWQTKITAGQTMIIDNLQEILLGQKELSNCQKDMHEEIVRLAAGLNTCHVPCNVSSETSSDQGEKVEQCKHILVDTDELPRCKTAQSLEVKKVGNRRIKTAKRKAKKPTGSESVSAIKNLTDQSKLMVEQHEQDQVYVETKAVKRGLQILDSHNLLFLVAKSGSGKSKLCLQIASLMKQQKAMIPILLLNNEVVNKRDLISPLRNYLLIIEDFFGKENPSYDKDIHDNILSYIQSWTCLGKTKVIMTISAGIGVVSDILKRHSLFKDDCILNIDVNVPLNVVEKQTILYKHAKMNSILLSNKPCNPLCGQKVQNLQDGSFEICQCLVQNIISTDTYIGFPQCCSMFCQDQCLTQLGIKYFRNPSDELIQQINTQLLGKAINKDLDCLYRYALLVYMAITGSVLKPSYEQNDELFKEKLLLGIFTSINESTVNIRKGLVNIALKYLQTSYLKKMVYVIDSVKHPVVEFQHYTIKKAVLLSFGGEYPDKVINYCDIEFIIDFVFPRGIRPASIHPTDLISVDHKLVLNRIYKILLDSLQIIKQSSSGIRVLSQKEKDTSLKRGESFIPFDDCLKLVVEIGRYLKQYSEGNEKPIEEFMDEISTSGMVSLIEFLLEGFSESGTFDQFLTTFPSISKKYLLTYGNPSVFSRTVRPTSSQCSKNQFLYVDDSVLICTLLKRLNTSEWGFNILNEYEIGKYASFVANDGNSEFFWRIIKKYTNSEENIGCQNASLAGC